MSQNLRFPDKESFHRFALESWTAAVNSGDFERAVAFDQLHYNELVKKFEDVSYWDRWQADTLEPRRALTRRMELLIPLALPESDGSNRFLIVHHNYSGLAHETQLARNMAWLKAHDVDFNVEIVYLFGPSDRRSLASKLYGLPPDGIHYLSAANYQQAAERLSRLAQTRSAQGIIYPTTFFMAFWMSVFVPHANQKFVQMKYYPLHAGRMSRWAGGYRGPGKHYRIHGCDYEQLPILDLQIAKRELPFSQAQSGAVSIGSISRPEKVGNPAYNQFILALLKKHPQLSYLYTGRPDALSAIPDSVRNHPRSKSLGWVNPVDAISTFNIYLEPFPWGGGEMTLLALEAGLPYLTLETEESIRFGIYGFIKCMAEGKDPILQFSFCKSIEQLHERVAVLLSDPQRREQLGRAWREAVLNYTPPGLESWHSLLND